MRTVAILGLLLLLGLAWMFWRTDETAPVVPAATPTVEAGAGTEPASAAASPTAAEAAASADASVQRTELPAPVIVATGPEAVLKGRCIDEQGAPIAGVEAQLTGWGANSQRTDAWSKDHGKPERIEVKVTSGDDGAFEFRFWPPPPFQFMLRLTKPGVATAHGRWSQLEPGATKDLGDLRLPRGALLRGRVVDSDGVPVAKAEVHFDLKEKPKGEVAPQDWDIGYAKDDGTFACRWSLIAGEYTLDLPHRTIVSPKSVTIAGDRTEQFVEVVVAKIDDSKAVAGVVVDEEGKPIRSVTVRPTPAPGGRGWIINSDKDGRFRVPQPEQGGAKAVALSLEREGYERLATTETFEWGRNDIRLTMKRALDVQLSVVDAEGAPVEDYQVRIFPQPGTTQVVSSRDYEVRGQGRHEGGRATIRGIRRGNHFVVVEPKGEELAMSSTVPVEVADPGPSVVTVTLARTVQRELRVQRPDGTPVAAAKVQLADPLGNEVNPRLRVVAMDRWGMGNSKRALELHAATTDANGSARLRGPGDRALVVILPGPGHVPTAVADVRLTEVQPLVVTVGSGAALTVTLRPLAALGEVRRGAGLPPTGRVDDAARRFLPRIELQQGGGMTMETYPNMEQPVYVEDDGTFALAGIPPGTWQVRLTWWFQEEQRPRGESENVASVTLQEGEDRRIEVDVAHLSPGILDGLALHNGAALANTRLTAIGSRGNDAQGNDRSNTLSVTTDAEGRFQLRARAGEYRISWQRQQGGGWSSLRAAESIHVVAGQNVAQTFHLRSGTVRVRLLDAQGQPVALVPIQLRDAEGRHQQNLPPTDADGRTSGEVEAESFTAAVLPQHLQDQKAQLEFRRTNPGNPDVFAAVRLQCGTVQAQMGATTEVELRLTVAWPR